MRGIRSVSLFANLYLFCVFCCLRVRWDDGSHNPQVRVYMYAPDWIVLPCSESYACVSMSALMRALRTIVWFHPGMWEVYLSCNDQGDSIMVDGNLAYSSVNLIRRRIHRHHDRLMEYGEICFSVQKAMTVGGCCRIFFLSESEEVYLLSQAM